MSLEYKNNSTCEQSSEVHLGTSFDLLDRAGHFIPGSGNQWLSLSSEQEAVPQELHTSPRWYASLF